MIEISNVAMHQPEHESNTKTQNSENETELF
jgi:hypothetical protein